MFHVEQSIQGRLKTMAGGAPKGRPKPPGSGRKKGTRNKQTEDAQALADRLGVDPFAILLHYASRNYDALRLPTTRTRFTASGMPYEEDTIPPELAQKSAKDAVPYLRPVLKSVEVSGPNGGPVALNFVDLAKELTGEGEDGE